MTTTIINDRGIRLDIKKVAPKTKVKDISTETFYVDSLCKEFELSEEEQMSQTLKRSAKQPDNIGFGFVLHFPAVNLNSIDQETLGRLAVKGMRLESSQPLWIRTKQPYYKATFKRGDTQTAKEAHAFFLEAVGIVYKNWK